MRSGLKLVQNVTYKSGQVVAEGANAIIPHRTGAVDVLVVEQPDGTIKSSPFYVRFGKYAALIGSREVFIEVNGHRMEFTMTMERYGTAYFTRQITQVSEDQDDDDATLAGMMSPSSGYASGDDAPFNRYDATLVPSAIKNKLEGLVKPPSLEGGMNSMRRTTSSIETQWSSNLQAQPSFGKHMRSNTTIGGLEAKKSDEIVPKLLDDRVVLRSKSSRRFNESFSRINTGLSSEEDRSEDEKQFTDRSNGRTLQVSASRSSFRSSLTKSRKVYGSVPNLGVSPPSSPSFLKKFVTEECELKKDIKKPPMPRVSFHLDDKDDNGAIASPSDKKPQYNLDKVPSFTSSESHQTNNSQIINSSNESPKSQPPALVQTLQQNNNVGLMGLNPEKRISLSPQGIAPKSAFEKAASSDETSIDFTEVQAHQPTFKVPRTITQLSLCWNELKQGLEIEQDETDENEQWSQQERKNRAQKIFDTNLVDEKRFLENLQKLIQDPNLAVRVGQRVYQFKDVLPALIALAVFQVDPLKAMESVKDLDLPYYEVENLEETVQGQLKDRSLSWTSYLLSFLSQKKGNMPDDRPRRKVVHPTEEQLQMIAPHLQDGSNKLEYVHSTERIECYLYKVKWDSQLVVSDVDGTITKSDVLGHVLPAIGWDWFQPGICQFFTNIRSNGYHMMYLSSRAIAQALQTREMLYSIEQGLARIPQGPVVISPEGILPSLYREVIQRRPHEFKIKALMDIKNLFPENCNPFYAGFGNRDTDERSYAEVGIPPKMIFTINPKGKIRRVEEQPEGEEEDLNLTILNCKVNSLFPKTKYMLPYDDGTVGRPSLEKSSEVFEEAMEDSAEEDAQEAVGTPYSPI